MVEKAWSSWRASASSLRSAKEITGRAVSIRSRSLPTFANSLADHAPGAIAPCRRPGWHSACGDFTLQAEQTGGRRVSQAEAKRMMHLGAFVHETGQHVAAW